MQQTLRYRDVIDGLRALAVLAVVIFHIDPKWLPGGFIGVDIFFVISGFLITSIICRQINGGTFSFIEFYRRRILRILPAATLVIATTLVVGHFVMLPNDLELLARSAAASQIWAGNIFSTYYLDTSYFADAAIFQPLLHLWSLGVEEQFYLFWPALLVFGMRWFRARTVWLVTAAITAASFLLGQYLLPDHASFAYYMLPTRAGQLLAGAMAAAIVYRSSSLSNVLASILSAAGLALTVWSLAYLSEESLYPGINAIPPTFGAVLLLLGGSAPKNVISLPFKLSPVRYIGLISFSLYLWHWPIVSFYTYVYGVPDNPAKLTLSVLIIGLSSASYHLVESPIRHLKLSPSAAFLRILVLPGSAVLLVSGLLWQTSGFGLYAWDPSYAAELERASKGSGAAYSAKYVCQATLISEAMMTNPDCSINGDKPKVLLWGDSNASHYVGAMTHVANRLGFSFQNIAHSSCPPLVVAPDAFVREQVVEPCKASLSVVQTALADFKVIILAAAWDSYRRQGGDEFIPVLGETIDRLRRDGKEVFVLGVIPRINSFDRKCQLKELKLGSLNCENRFSYNHKATKPINDELRKTAEEHRARFVSFNDALCSEDTCPLFIGDEGLYYDAGHWSVSGSLLIGETLAAAGKLPAGFAEIPSILMNEQAKNARQ